MDMMTKVDDATAFVRVGGGVFKQLDVFARGKRLYIPLAGGFVRICSRFGDTWPTTKPNVSVLEIEGDTLDLTGTKEPSVKETKRGR